MSEHPARGRDAPDDDIAKLFAVQADAYPVPPALDARLRAAAREAGLPTAGSASSDSAGNEHLTDERQMRGHRVSANRSRATLAPPRWLAAAAVLVLAVAIVPMLTKRAPDFGRDPAVEPAASAPPAESPSADVSTETVADAVATYRGANGVTTRQEAADVSTGLEAADVTNGYEADDATTGRDAATSAFVPRREVRAEGIAARATPPRADPPAGVPTTSVSAEAESPSPLASERTRAPDVALRSLADDRAATLGTRALPPSNADVDADAVANLAPSAKVEADIPDHERNPATWIEHLRARLRQDGFTPELREEYRRFRVLYPGFEPAFDPRAEARTTSGTERRGDGETAR